MAHTSALTTHSLLLASLLRVGLDPVDHLLVLSNIKQIQECGESYKLVSIKWGTAQYVT